MVARHREPLVPRREEDDAIPLRDLSKGLGRRAEQPLAIEHGEQPLPRLDEREVMAKLGVFRRRARVVSARATACCRTSGVKGLMRYSAAPLLMARTAGSTLSSAVMTMTSVPA